MAAPNNTSWSGDYSSSGKGRIGIALETTNTDATITVKATIWFWTRYSCNDISNTFYAGWSSDLNALSNIGAKSINTTNNSGVGWNTVNQVEIYSETKTFDRGTSDTTNYFSTKFTNVEYGGGSGNHSVSFTIPAKPAPSNYTLTFNPNDGQLPNPGGNLYNSAHTGSNYVNVTIGSSSYWAMANDIPTRTGYSFDGWYNAKTGGEKVYNSTGYCVNGSYWNDSIWNYSGDLTVYAQWKPNNYELKFNPNGGTFPGNGNLFNPSHPDRPNADYVPVEYDNTYYYTMYNDIPVREGHTFLGWYAYDSPAAGEYVYDSTGKAIECTYWKSNDDNSAYIWKYPNNLEVSAQWEPKQYTITFNGNGGKIVINSLSLLYGTIQNSIISEYIPSRLGYEFLGWYSSTSDGAQIYDSSGICTNEGTYWENNTYIHDGDLVLYAHWKPLNCAYVKDNDHSYKVSYVYCKTEENKWTPAIAYIKTDQGWKQSIVGELSQEKST